MWENFKRDCLINEKAQAILELATFGSVVLFCLALLIHFGLQMNYQQNAQMQAFRKGQKLAFYKQGPNSQASLSVLKDKPIVDPRDRWGFADRVSVGGSGSVTWSSTLNGVLVNHIGEIPDDRDMPRTYIEVNKKTDADKAQTKDGMGLADSEINDGLDRDRIGYTKVIEDDIFKDTQKGVFTTGSWMWQIGVHSSIGVYLEDSRHEHGPRDYYPLVLNPGDIKVFEDPEDPEQKSAVYQYAGLKRTLSAGVIISSTDDLKKFQNGESRPLSIIAVKGELGNNCDDDNYCGKITEILSIVPQFGEIDTYYVDVKPGDKDKTIQTKQGVLMDSEKKLEYGSGAKLSVTETNVGIYTKTDSAATQTVIHKLRLNNGTVVDIPAEFKPAGIYKYDVKHE